MGAVHSDSDSSTSIPEARKIAYCKAEIIHCDCICHGYDSFESDFGPVDSAVRDLLEPDRGAEDQCAQFLRAELLGVDRGSWQG